MGNNPLRRILSALLFSLLLSVGGTSYVHAAFGSGNIMCTTPPHIGNCPFNMPCPKAPILGVIGKPCQETANGKTCTGKCISVGICKAAGCDGIGGGSEAAGIGKALEAAMGMLKDLLKPKGGGGGGGGGGAPPGGFPSTGPLYPTCVHNEATKTVAPIPCTEANGQINYGGNGFTDSGLTGDGGGSLGNSTADALLNALNGGGLNLDANTNASTDTEKVDPGTENSSNTNTGTTSQKQTKIVIEGEGSLQPGQNQEGSLQGDILVGGSGGLLYARSRDLEKNTEVAGFYGGNVTGQTQSSGLIGRMCRTRPWGNGMLGGLISGNFFDGLCKRFGYSVGEIAVPQGGGGGGASRGPSISIQGSKSRPATTSMPAIQPEVDIWANPSSVRLGTRTYIFWNTRDVESCVETGPSFSHNTLSGGASTVPLSDASIFSIECKTIDGRTITDSVRVTIAL